MNIPTFPSSNMEKPSNPATKFLIPLSYVTILGGICTLIGTSTNLVVHGMILEAGFEGFSMFELRSREIHRFSPMLDNRSKNNHDRRIIQKGRNKSHRRQDTQLCFKHRCLSLRKQLLNHLSQCTRLTNTDRKSVV